MGRTSLHTKEQVFAAAERLRLEGKVVTAIALREALGGGSLTTIYKHLDAWKAEQKNKPQPFFFEMPESVKTAFDHVWHSATLEAGREITLIRSQAETDKASLTQRFEESLLSIEQLESELNEEAQKNDALTRSVEEQNNLIQEMKTQEAMFKAEIGSLKQQIDALITERDLARKEASSAREEAARLRGQVESMEAQQAELIRAIGGKKKQTK